MQIVSATPRLFCVRPGELRWQWRATFVRVNLARLLELGEIDQAFAVRANAEFDAAERDSNSVLITPLVLEVVARRGG